LSLLCGFCAAFTSVPVNNHPGFERFQQEYVPA